MPPKWKVGITPPGMATAAGPTGYTAPLPDDETTDPKCDKVNKKSESTKTCKKSVRDYLKKTDPGGGVLSDLTDQYSNRWNSTLGKGWGGGFLAGATQVVNLPVGAWLVRYGGPGINPTGCWWGPAPVSGDPRALLALPDNNPASEMLKGQVKSPDPSAGSVKALGGRGAPRCAGKPGGPYQVCLPFPGSDYIDLVPGCLIAIRSESELLPQAEQALAFAQQAMTARKKGAPGPGDVRQLTAIVNKLDLVVKQVRSASAPAAWQDREKEARPLQKIFEKGWDPTDDLGKLIYVVGHFYVHRTPHAIVSSVPEFEQALEEALPLGRKTLQERKSRKTGEGTVEQLELIVRYLEALDMCRKSGKYPTGRLRQAKAIGPMFADGWNPEDYLGILVSALDYFYVHTNAF